MVSKEKVSKRENPFTKERTTDTRTAREANVDPSIREEKTVPTPKRNVEDMELCLSCQTLHLKGTACPTCKLTEEQVKKTQWEKFHATGQIT